MKTVITEDMNQMAIGQIKEFAPSNTQWERLIRVPNGWVYTYGSMQGECAVFIPYTLKP